MDRADFDFDDSDMGVYSQEMSALGIEKTPDEWRDYLIFCCELHCREHPEHRDLPTDELWPIVNARINDDNDMFPNDAAVL